VTNPMSRIASLERLKTVTERRRVLDLEELACLEAARGAGATWAEIARCTGRRGQTGAKTRYGRLKERYSR
jgi:hypothetical protein